MPTHPLNRRTLTRRHLVGTLSTTAAALAAAQLLAACGGAAAPGAPVQASTTAATKVPAQAGSTPASAAGTTPSTVGAASTSASGGHLTEGTFADAQVLNPILSTDTSSGEIISLLFNGVLTINPKTGQPEPRLAETVQASSDGLTYTFTLRKGVKFHDGKELTADDVKFTYDTIFDPEVNSPRRSSLAQALSGPESITVKDPHTVEFKLKQTYAPFLAQQMLYGILPKHLLGDKKGKAFNSADFNTKSPVGTGPFEFKEWVKDDHITLIANPDYYLGKPKIDQYIYKIVKDATVVAAQLKTGEIDYGGFEPALLEELKKAPNLNVKTFDNLVFTYFSYQLDKTKTDLFQEKAVRQALVYALDRKAMLESIMFNQGAVADSIYPLISWARNPEGNPNYNYNPDKAKQLLDGAGWKAGSDGIREKNGKKLAFTLYTNAGNKVREAFVTAMQDQWKAIGVNATPKTEEWNAFLNRIGKSHDFEAFLVGFSWGVDPDETTMWGTKSYNAGFNDNKYSNAEVDKLLDQGIRTVDLNKRKEIYHKLDGLILDDLPSPILVFGKSLVAVNKRVQGLDPNAYNTLYNIHQVSVSDGK